jgi:hypothetical protein
MAAKEWAMLAGEKGPVLRLRSGRRQSQGIGTSCGYFSGELSSEPLVFGAR